MKKTTIESAKYKRLLKLAKGGGSKDAISTVLGTDDPKVIGNYLDHLKATDPDAVPAGWTVEEDDDLDDFGLDDDEEAKAGDDIQGQVTEAVTAVQAAGGKSLIPEKFRLRNENGETIELECFSKGHFGYILRVPVPTDIRTVNVKGKDITVDYLAIQRDPDGTTEGVSNRKLAALIELDL